MDEIKRPLKTFTYYNHTFYCWHNGIRPDWQKDDGRKYFEMTNAEVRALSPEDYANLTHTCVDAQQIMIDDINIDKLEVIHIAHAHNNNYDEHYTLIYRESK